jgi:hypothetical protein
MIQYPEKQFNCLKGHFKPEILSEGSKTMGAFRLLLVIMIIGILSITGIVIFNHGWNLLPIFFGDMASLTWPGQFNFDFTCFLLLSGLWLAWRHHFSPGGLLLGLVGVFGGIMLLAPYLLFASYKANGSMKVLLLGKARANI